MQVTDEELGLTILLVSITILLLSIGIIALLFIFRKKSQMNLKERELMRSTYEKSILQSQLEIQEQTFNDISQEIHDNVGQVLSLAKVQIGIINTQLQIKHELLDSVKDNISNAIADLRSIAKGLSSDRINMLTINEAISIEVEKINKSTTIEAYFVSTGDEQLMGNQKKLILFRIIQEIMQNTMKYSAATTLQVIFIYSQTTLEVKVADNGIGFTVAEVTAKRDGLGLMNMKNRAVLAGGDLEVKSAPTNGTTIKIIIPYN